MQKPANSFNKALLALAMGAFGIALTEFVIMGILPEVARGMSVSIPQAGHFIAAYALGVVLGAPFVSQWGLKRSPRSMLLLLMAWFTVFNLLCAFAQGYTSMLVLRFLSGLPHGAFFGIGAVMAARLGGEGKEAHAIAVMYTGFTVANVVGVPLGTYIGNSIEWYASFVMVGIVGLLTVLALWLWMPGLSLGNTTDKKMKFADAGGWELWALLGLTAVGTGGFFAWYSYIAPLLIEVSGHSALTVSYAMVLAGLGMIVGNFAGARLLRRMKPVQAIAFGMLLMAILLVVNYFVAPSAIGSLLMCFIIGGVTFSLAAPIQMGIINASKGSAVLGSSLNQSAFNIANASGAYIAGLPIALGYGFTAPSLVGALLATLGGLIAIGIWRRKRSNSPI